jgi:hypothetical protein
MFPSHIVTFVILLIMRDVILKPEIRNKVMNIDNTKDRQKYIEEKI